jgi:hypothetical protein
MALNKVRKSAQLIGQIITDIKSDYSHTVKCGK